MLTLKPQHQDTAIAKIQRAKEQVNYHEKEVRPFLKTMEAWKSKEYLAVYKDNLSEVNNLKELILSNEGVFNNILFCYNITATVFIAKYINN